MAFGLWIIFPLKPTFFYIYRDTWLLGDRRTSTSHTSDRSHAVYVSAVSKGDPLPGAKRIGWLKTSDFEGCNRHDGGASKRKRAPSQWSPEAFGEPELGLIIGLSSICYPTRRWTAGFRRADYHFNCRRGLCHDPSIMLCAVLHNIHQHVFIFWDFRNAAEGPFFVCQTRMEITEASTSLFGLTFPQVVSFSSE